jgi:hypothetical protein
MITKWFFKEWGGDVEGNYLFQDNDKCCVFVNVIREIQVL